jgi:hypothetical protein
MGSYNHLHSDLLSLLNYIKDEILKADDDSENIVLFTPKKE